MTYHATDGQTFEKTYEKTLGIGPCWTPESAVKSHQGAPAGFPIAGESMSEDESGDQTRNISGDRYGKISRHGV